MSKKIDFQDAVGLYLELGSSVLSRVSSKLIAGFQSAFLVDEATRLDYYRTRGVEHTKAGRYTRALPLLELVREQRPEDLETLLHLGLCLIRLDRKEEGIGLLEAAYGRDGGNPSTAKVLGLAYAQAGEHARALPVLTAAVRAYPEHFGLLYRLGACLDHLGRTSEAVGYFERALEQRPKAVKVLRALAYALEQLGERERALACFKRADEQEDAEK